MYPVPASVCSSVVTLIEQRHLCRIARGFGKTEMLEGVRGKHSPARRALDEAFLDQIRLDDVLDRVARLGERGRDRLDADRSAAIVLCDQREVAAIHRVETGGVHFEMRKRPVGARAIKRLLA